MVIYLFRNNSGAVKRRNVLAMKATNQKTIAIDTRKRCCPKNCLSELLSEGEVTILRDRFWQRDEEAQRSYILQYFEMFLNHDGALEFNLKGQVICRNAWLTALKISNGR